MVGSREAGGNGLRARLVLALAPGAWFAILLLAARALVVAALERTHGSEWGLVRVRLASALPGAALSGILLGMPGALLLLQLDAWRPAARWTLRALLAAAVAAVGLALLTGRLGADLSQRVGLETPRGRAVSALLALGALALGAALVWLTSWRARSAIHPGRTALLPLGLLLCVALGLRLAGTGPGERMLVRAAEVELYSAPWDVLASFPDEAPGPRVLCPSSYYGDEGAGMPSLCLPPPARVRVRAPEQGALWLAARAGIDRSAREDLGEAYGDCSVRFLLRIDGKRRFERSLRIADSKGWIPVGGQEGIAVPPGGTIELETALFDAAGREIVPRAPVRAGFGGLDLERRELRARVRASRERPSIVLVLVDTLRADRTSVHGYDRRTTPNLEALARRGLVFEEACATASWTWPSTASLFTGLQPEEHGVLDANTSFLAEPLDTLAEALQRQGFTTAAWSASPMIVADKNFDQGFEIFHGPRSGGLRPSEEIVPPALDWLAAIGDWRFFLYLHLVDPHSPLRPLPEGRALFASEVPADFDPRSILDLSWKLRHSAGESDGGVPAEVRRWIGDLYDACVWSADAWIGRLLERLEALGLAERTIVVVTSDHGEELFDHGLLAHAHTVHRELVRVPLIAAGPGLPAGIHVERPVSISWLAPTLARAGGGRIEGLAAPLDLFSLDGEPREVLFSTRQGWWNGSAPQAIYGLLERGFALHFAPQMRAELAGALEGQCRLFDRSADPREDRDLASVDPERVREMRAELVQRLQDLNARRSTRALPMDEATLEMLREIGYAGR